MSNHKILLVEDERKEREALSDVLTDLGYVVVVAADGIDALVQIKSARVDLILTDFQMPNMNGLELLSEVKGNGLDIPVVFISGHSTVDTSVEAMKLGAFDFFLKPISIELIKEIVEKVFERQGSHTKARNVSQDRYRLVTKEQNMIQLMNLARSIANSKASVLIQGESGTGKELFAHFIHNNSSRGNKPFVAVNCAALPDGLLESELFGYEKGAFTGAISRKLGKFELAQGGTILLDEISEMALHLQAKLLRVLQEEEIDRVGGNNPIPIDVRVIATTNRNIETAIKEKSFREDFYYRLNVIPLKIPPLRDRADDVIVLANYFIEKYNRIDDRDVKGLTDGALQILTSQYWRGNVRELENVIERAVLLCKEKLIGVKDLFITENPRSECNRKKTIMPVGTLREMEKQLIFNALDQTNGNRTHAARILGINVRTLRNKLNEYREQMETLT
jgi:two-component system response regulator FlrC